MVHVCAWSILDCATTDLFSAFYMDLHSTKHVLQTLKLKIPQQPMDGSYSTKISRTSIDRAQNTNQLQVPMCMSILIMPLTHFGSLAHVCQLNW
jgi:hypothetical protein